jgi:ribulose kinase
MDLSDLAQKWPQRILPLGAPVGRLTAEAAAHTGLPEGLLVAQVRELQHAFAHVFALRSKRKAHIGLTEGLLVAQVGWKDSGLI